MFAKVLELLGSGLQVGNLGGKGGEGRGGRGGRGGDREEENDSVCSRWHTVSLAVHSTHLYV